MQVAVAAAVAAISLAGVLAYRRLRTLNRQLAEHIYKLQASEANQRLLLAQRVSQVEVNGCIVALAVVERLDPVADA